MSSNVLQLEYRWIEPGGIKHTPTSISYTSIFPHTGSVNIRVGAGGDVQRSLGSDHYFIIEGVPTDFDFLTPWNWFCCDEIKPGGWWPFKRLVSCGPGVAHLKI